MMKSVTTAAIATASLLLCLAGCGRSDRSAEARASITADDLMKHIRTLASDQFEGRAPGTKGEELTVEYLTSEFKTMGLQPGNPDGSYVQKVPLVGIVSQVDARITAGGRPLSLEGGKNFVANSARAIPQVSVTNSDLLFVGYGVQAPEYQWDDFKGVDVSGKTLVVLVNDPPVPAPTDPNELDESLFKGKAMTYYGRWPYKYEVASELGAAAVLIVHETGPAGYPFEVVGSRWGLEGFDITRPDKNMNRIAVEGWISVDKARELFRLSGEDFDTLKKNAVSRDFKPVPLKAKANFQVKNTVREVQSSNVIAKVVGEIADEYVIYTAHWDHLGRNPTLEGDQIYNGAIDNASGTAVLLELAEAFAGLKTQPRRSVLFLAVTAEEKGLLGARFYGQNPLYPLNKTLANINMDGINQWGRTEDLVVVGLGNSTLDEVAAAVAKEQNRRLEPDAEPEKGFFYRSDHFELAKQGVPALYTDSGTRFIGKPEGYGMEKREAYTANDYHKVSDEIKPDWDLAGAVEDARLLFEVGYRVANGDKWPEWKPGTEFKAKREASLQ